MHQPSRIFINNADGLPQVCKTKYDNWGQDRTALHYSQLFTKGLIYKMQVDDITRSTNAAMTIYQIWIQSNDVSVHMYEAIQSWIKLNPTMNYKLLTNEKILTLIQDEIEFPRLKQAYLMVKPYAYKSDLIRYYVLYKYGGCYCDTDMVCYSSIVTLCEQNDIVISLDIEPINVSNGFLCAKKGCAFFKYLTQIVIDNIINKRVGRSDLALSGPQLFGDIFCSFFKQPRPFTPGSHSINGLMIHLIKYSFTLPLPKGSWVKTSRNAEIIKGNILQVECLSASNEWVRNIIQFSAGDTLENKNGQLIGNTPLPYVEVAGSGFMYSGQTLYCVSKYPTYNEQRLLLDGNDFAKMYANKEVFM